MRGKIYTEQKCSLCGANLVLSERHRACLCPEHPQIRATGRFIVTFGRKVRKRFARYDMAERFLDGLRYEVDKGTFEAKDYASNNPLSFTYLTNMYLLKKKGSIADSYHVRLSGQIKKAQDYFGNTNVKQIKYSHLEDFIDSQRLSDKSKHNLLSILHAFYQWAVMREEIHFHHVPKFPTISYQSKLRKTVSKDVQQDILREVARISVNVSPKIYIGIKFLCTYISIRPAELLNIQSGHINKQDGYVLIPHPKEKEPKIVPLLPEDVYLIRSCGRDFPQHYFFRHRKGCSGVRAGQRFGAKLLYKWWKIACDNLGIKDVDLYGGTRHSSAIALRTHCTPEQIKRATLHSTSKAFDRYFQISREELQEMYSHTSGKSLEYIGKTKKAT